MSNSSETHHRVPENSELGLELREIVRKVETAMQASDVLVAEAKLTQEAISALIAVKPDRFHFVGLGDLTLLPNQSVQLHQQNEEGTCETVVLQDPLIPNVRLNARGFMSLPEAVLSFRMRLLITVQCSETEKMLVRSVCEIGDFNLAGEKLGSPKNPHWVYEPSS